MARRAATPAPESGGKKRHVFSREAREETDPEWRQWFLEIERRRKEARDPKRKPLVFSRVEKEGETQSVLRRKVEPKKLATFIKHDAKKTGRSFSLDLALIESTWKHAVGKEMSEETRIFAFKNGVLTISVFSSSLLQEIRQFHQEALLQDLRDIWQLPIPLVKVVYKLGKK